MGKDLYYRNRHSCYLLQYNLVVIIKYRYPVLKDQIKDKLISIAQDVSQDDWKTNIIAINTYLDHIHILFEAHPQVQLSKLVNNFKTVSSRLIRKEFSEQLKPYFWSSSYFICTVSEKSEAIVKKYIESQNGD